MKIVYSPKFKTKTHLDRYIKDMYAVTGKHLVVPIGKTTEQLHQESSITITAKNEKGFYRAEMSKKPGKRMVFAHPVFVQIPKRRRL